MVNVGEIYTTKYNAIPVYEETDLPSGHRAEMGTQLLKGELCEVLSLENMHGEPTHWAKICSKDDGYIGYVLQSQLVVPNRSTTTIKKPLIITKRVLDSFREKFADAPYMRGGRTPAGVDCSGLTKAFYTSVGTSIPRNASQQAERGDEVASISDALPGDIVCFRNSRKGGDAKTSHVGIYAGDRKVFHVADGQSQDPTAPRNTPIHPDAGGTQLQEIDDQGMYVIDDLGKHYVYTTTTIRRRPMIQS